MNSSREDLIDKYGIIEGFLPLEEQVVYSMELTKLNIKAAYEIELYDKVTYYYNKNDCKNSYFTKSKFNGIPMYLNKCFIQQLRGDLSNNQIEKCVLAYKPIEGTSIYTGLAKIPLLQDAVDATLQLSSPQDTKLLRKKHENQKLMKTSQ